MRWRISPVFVLSLLLLPPAASCGRGSDDAVASFGQEVLALTPTFQSMGIRASFTGDGNGDSVCRLELRPSGAASWRRAHDLWADHDRSLFVGSVVLLDPDTAYEFRLTVEDPDGVPDPDVVSASARTWSETFPVGDQETASDGATPVTIDAGGTAAGYRLFAPPSGERATIDVGTGTEDAMTIDADYVIVRNIDFVGGSRNGIRIANDRHDIVIEDCTFTRFGPAGKAHGPDTLADGRDNAAIAVGTSWDGSGVARVVIQRNTIHDPNGGSNSWDEGHPTGPHAIFLLETDGNHVIRYNRIASSPDHWYNDAIGGGRNFSTTHGNINRDTDIYGNVISEVWDDAIEAEGRDENCRIWGNFIESSFVAIATGAITVGPLYAFRNVFVRNVASESNPDESGIGFKCGYEDGIQGPQLVYFNTITGPDGPRHALGAWAGPVYNATTRDNIFDVEGTVISDDTESPTNSFDYDLLRPGARWKTGEGDYEHAIYGNPVFAPSGPYGGGYGLFLDPSSPGYRAGTAVANFGDGADGSPIDDPDVGAFDERFPPLLFGPTLE
jgi:hypothetical protein